MTTNKVICGLLNFAIASDLDSRSLAMAKFNRPRPWSTFKGISATLSQNKSSLLFWSLVKSPSKVTLSDTWSSFQALQTVSFPAGCISRYSICTSIRHNGMISYGSDIISIGLWSKPCTLDKTATPKLRQTNMVTRSKPKRRQRDFV